ncbi:tail fiber domain-containing protein [Bradyrhizobium lablabi]|uniref:tail fiber domain-containing protein n=1 Tax=Bradyrhizobium lablabi TaxID=722472 RepID=UPI001BA5C31C|nr:tail fiber domain-containing protein [Bradyrhizobium lablabi]MBR0693687.1 tail fiber domain-containing protein [Bradyrhizobium lablabi]
MTHKIRIVPSQPETPDNPGLDSLNQLSGMIQQAAGLSGAGVGLPGLNSLGSSISSLASSFTGGAGGTFASAIATAGTSMMSASAGAMAGLVSSMQSALSSLTGALGAGLFAQAIHTHVLDAKDGILASAFQGQHKTTWDNNGVTHTSSQAVTTTAPQLPHNGNLLASDNLILTKVMTALSYVTTSDARLKSDIKDLPPVLDKAMKIKVKTFRKRFVRTNERGEHSIHEDGVRSMGVIAQEYQKHFPELVHRTTDFLGVEESKIGIIALVALQEFVEEQRREIAELKRQLKAKA